MFVGVYRGGARYVGVYRGGQEQDMLKYVEVEQGEVYSGGARFAVLAEICLEFIYY